jgi:hypothetical protein
MMRVGGRGTEKQIPTPEALGTWGAQFYVRMDDICRRLARDVATKVDVRPSVVDQILDPVLEQTAPGKNVTVERVGDAVACPNYFPPGYISSSILDSFHYFGVEKKSANEELHDDQRHINNHSAHTDSGLLTVVVCTDEPGLEVYDEFFEKWFAVEQLLHDFVRRRRAASEATTTTNAHRRYAFVFWGDSIAYLSKQIAPCLHRVGSSRHERVSVVFKQRCLVLATACRYQEDYKLADQQQKALDATNIRVVPWSSQNSNNSSSKSSSSNDSSSLIGQTTRKTHSES